MKLERIACVEDDLDIRTILEMSLSEVGGFTVELYEDGPSALEALSDVPPQLKGGTFAEWCVRIRLAVIDHHSAF